MHCGPTAVTLHIGTVTESVTIGATLAADTVKTYETSLIGRRLIQDLPIKGCRADPVRAASRRTLRFRMGEAIHHPRRIS